MSRPRPAVVRPQRLAFAIAALLPFGTALAQDAATTTAEKEAATLDTVEVTAQRKVENIQDVPVSITSIDAMPRSCMCSAPAATTSASCPRACPA